MPTRFTRRELAMVGASTLRGRRKPRSRSPLGRLRMRPTRPKIRALFLQDFSGARPRPPTRSRAPSTRTGEGARSGIRSRTRREKSGTTTTRTSPTITIAATRKTCGPIKELGVKAYRFSIAWPRVFPKATARRTRRASISMIACWTSCWRTASSPMRRLYHWDLPQSLQDRSADGKPAKPPRAFANYAGYVAERLSDRVKTLLHAQRMWKFLELGYATGASRRDSSFRPEQINQARHQCCSATGSPCRRSAQEGARARKIGPAENIGGLPAGDRNARECARPPRSPRAS